MVQTQETVTFAVEVDSRGATKGLAEVDRALTSTDGFAKRLWTSLNTVEGKTVSLGEQAKLLQQKMGPAAAAISGVSAALGQQAGEAGKAVAAAGQLVAAYGSGGPVAVAVVGMTVLVGKLQEGWDATLAAQDRAVNSGAALVAAAVAQLATVRREIDAINRASGNYSSTSREDALQKARGDLAQLEAAAAAARNGKVDYAGAAQAAEARGTDLTDEVKAFTAARDAQVRVLDKAVDVQRRLVDTASRAVTEEREQVKWTKFLNDEKQKEIGLNQFLVDGLAEYQTQLEKARQREQEYFDRVVLPLVTHAREEVASLDGDISAVMRAPKGTGGLGGVLRGEDVRGPGPVGLASPFAGPRDGVGGPRSGVAGAADAFQQEVERNIAIADDWRVAWVSAGRAVASSFGSLQDGVTAATQIAVAGTQQVVADLITGQEHVAERFAVLIMGQAGQSLISSGIKLLGEATVSAFTPGGQLIAGAQAAAGGGLIAAGIGLGGIAAGIEHVAAGGKIGQALPDNAARTSSGVNRGGPQGRNSRASAINVTVIYAGASGPTAEQGSRAVVKALANAKRRGAA